jgi:hypothetical protein
MHDMRQGLWPPQPLYRLTAYAITHLSLVDLSAPFGMGNQSRFQARGRRLGSSSGSILELSLVVLFAYTLWNQRWGIADILH